MFFAAKNNCLKETISETWYVFIDYTINSNLFFLHFACDRTILIAHLNELQTSHWRGLPELTNENGSYCVDSCRTQAWSMSTVLEVRSNLVAFLNHLYIIVFFSS